VARLFDLGGLTPVGVGSVLLSAEVLPKPLRADANSSEARALSVLLRRLELWPIGEEMIASAVVYAVEYGLRAPDAIHLATAVAAKADRFLTNNRKDFPKSITDIAIVYPDDLPA
jgi:predicted nucleic acid-binding protein